MERSGTAQSNSPEYFKPQALPDKFQILYFPRAKTQENSSEILLHNSTLSYAAPYAPQVLILVLWLVAKMHGLIMFEYFYSHSIVQFNAKTANTNKCLSGSDLGAAFYLQPVTSCRARAWWRYSFHVPHPQHPGIKTIKYDHLWLVVLDRPALRANFDLVLTYYLHSALLSSLFKLTPADEQSIHGKFLLPQPHWKEWELSNITSHAV